MPGSAEDEQGGATRSSRREDPHLFSRLFRFRTANSSPVDEHEPHLTPGYYTHTSYWPVTSEDHQISLDELYDGLNSMTTKQYDAAMTSLADTAPTAAPLDSSLADQHKLDT